MNLVNISKADRMTKPELSRIPMPENAGRIETGPLKFGDDGTGVFIRGDNAQHAAQVLLSAMNHIPEDDILLEHNLSKFVKLLKSCKE